MNIKQFIIAACAVTLTAVAQADNISGAWSGSLSLGASKLRLVLHVDGDKASLDSPDQGAYGIEGKTLFASSDSVSLSFPPIGASYCGRLDEDTLRGTFTQRDIPLPLDLTLGAPERVRPQTPQPPFPYTTEELVIADLPDSTRIVGTLTLAGEVGKTPVVLFVSGSGQQNRDEEIYEHKPFAVLADRLARAGISSFRYDDRGIGCSTGLRDDLTTEDFKNDALHLLRTLRQRGLGSRYGIIGHSEGGLIAFMAAAESPGDVDFIVSIAGTGVPGDSILERQIKRAHPELTPEMVQFALLQASQSPWVKYFIGYDPKEALQRVTCPVMAIGGSNDTQVDAAQNLGAIRANLPLKPGDMVKEYPGLNHLMQHSQTGDYTEYAEIEETISDEVIADIIAWLLSLNQ